MNFYSSIFRQLNITYKTSLRSYCSENIEPIKYFGFTYYPRHKNFKDPPYIPSKLFLITRIKSMRGATIHEKETLAKLNIDGSVKFKRHISIVKNIPEINAMLWTVKHLIVIKPITWKGELPNDFCGTYLKNNGELVINPLLKIPEKVIESSESQANNKLKLSKKYIKSYLLKKWVEGNYC